MNFNFEFYLWRSNCVSISTDSQTHRQTDKLIWGGLGNLQFLQVNSSLFLLIRSSSPLLEYVLVVEAAKLVARSVQFPRLSFVFCVPCIPGTTDTPGCPLGHIYVSSFGFSCANNICIRAHARLVSGAYSFPYIRVRYL